MVEKRRRWMVRRRLEGRKINDIAEALRINEKTVDRWCGIHGKHGGRVYASSLGDPHDPQDT